MTDLIERLETLHNYYALHPGDREQKTAEALLDTITALKSMQAPLPDDVYRVSNYLRHEIPLDYAGAEEAADMLERLWRESTTAKAAFESAFRRADELQQRIEKLADLNADYKNVMDGQRERIEELDAIRKFHIREIDRLDAALDELREIILRECPEAMPAYAVIVGKARAGE